MIGTRAFVFEFELEFDVYTYVRIGTHTRYVSAILSRSTRQQTARPVCLELVCDSSETETRVAPTIANALPRN